jgi:hypothetical protein
MRVLSERGEAKDLSHTFLALHLRISLKLAWMRLHPSLLKGRPASVISSAARSLPHCATFAQ